MAATSALVVAGWVGDASFGIVAEIVGDIGAGVAMLTAGRRHRDRAPERAVGWSLVGSSLVLFGIGVTPYLVWPERTATHSVLEMIGAPLLFVGLGRLRRSLQVPRDVMRLAALDGLLVGTAGAMVTWMVAFEPFIGRFAVSAVLETGVFPIVGALVLSYWILPLFLLDHHNTVARSLVFITLSVVAVSLAAAVADLSGQVDVRRVHGLYGLVMTFGAVSVANDRCWVEGKLRVDSAFLDPERIALICISLAVVPTALIVSVPLGATPNLLVPGGAAAVMVALVTIRLRRALRDADSLQTRLRHLAEVDPLTGLPNRRAAEARLSALEPSATEIAVLFIDLDRFKPINDAHGHEVGDLLLNAVADRLRYGTRTEDLVARFGGDEFVIVAPGLGREQAEFAARRIQRLLCESYEVRGRRVTIGASIGFAVGGAGGDHGLTHLVELADQAMYRSKATRAGPVLATAPLEAVVEA